ncbi:DUF6359 domain-containing protein [Aerococcaceae bacterium NML210727]|nr:DUF6359 domain-containing protein [Aerococcaceae bacterium NML210727]
MKKICQPHLKLTRQSFKGKSRLALSFALASLGIFALGHHQVSAEEASNVPTEEVVADTATPTALEAAEAPADTNAADEEAVIAESANPVHTVDAFKNNPALIGETVTVEGVVTGALDKPNKYGNVKSNLALGASADAPADVTVPVQLPSGALRTQYNVVDNPQLIGKHVRVTGRGDKYFGRAGLKTVTNIEVVETQPNTPPATEPPVEQPPVATPTATPIADVRTAQQGQTYTVQGQIISAINGWGGDGFYIQDASQQGLYIYPRTTLGYKTGDSVLLSGKLSNFNNELQLVDITHHQKVAPIAIAEPQTLAINQLSNAHQSTLVKLTQLTVGQTNTNAQGTVTFNVTDEAGNSIAVRVDNRTGLAADALLAKIGTGDQINLTAILSTFKGTNQLKPFSLEQFEVVKKADTAVTPTPTPPTATQALTIGEIQGAAHVSPYINQEVTVRNAVVTYVDGANRFYVQDVTPDNNPKTSDGIMVYKRNHQLNLGDLVEIVATVEEFLGQGYNERAQTDLTITQLNAKTVTKTGTGEVPAPIVLGKDIALPTGVIDNDGMSVFDPEEDALDFWEALEGMVVAIDNAKILGPQQHREVYVLPGDYNGKLNQVNGLLLGHNDYNPEKIALLFTKPLITKAGDTFAERVSGPVTYSFTNYKILVNAKELPKVIDGGLQPEKTSITFHEDKLTIASYNIENFSADKNKTPDEKVERIARSIITDLNSPDIVTLIEVQDNDGDADSGNTDASLSAQRLIDAIKALGGIAYQYTDIAPENNKDGGAPGGNIRTGFLYNPLRVTLADKPKADVNTPAEWENGALKYSVARVTPTDPAWKSVRKPLVANFQFKGEDIAVIAVHLNSKRGDNGVFGRVQPVKFASEPKRHKLAELLHHFVSVGHHQNPNAHVAILGDFNDFEFSKTMDILEKDLLFNLVRNHDIDDRFSYFYQGNYQSLDNVVLSNNLKNRYVFDMVHVNSPFMVAHGRASDHDPLLVQLDFSKKEVPAPTPQPEPTPTPEPTPQPPVTEPTPMPQPQVPTPTPQPAPEQPNKPQTDNGATTIIIDTNKDNNTMIVVPKKDSQTVSEGKQTTPSTASTPSQTLPETGEQNIAWFGATALSILAGLGLTLPKRKEN